MGYRDPHTVAILNSERGGATEKPGSTQKAFQTEILPGQTVFRQTFLDLASRPGNSGTKVSQCLVQSWKPWVRMKEPFTNVSTNLIDSAGSNPGLGPGYPTTTGSIAVPALTAQKDFGSSLVFDCSNYSAKLHFERCPRQGHEVRSKSTKLAAQGS
jgi:hypothetical protein